MKKKSRRIRRIKIFIIVGAIIVISALLFSSAVQLRRFLEESRLFSVETVEVNLKQPGLRVKKSINELESLKGKSLFSIDIDELSSKLSSRYAQFKRIIVHRRFPHKIYVEFIKRQPFLQFNIAGRYYVSDRTGIIISESSRIPFDGLIIVNTLLPAKREYAIGEKVEFAYSDNVVSLIDLIRKFGLNSEYNIAAVSAFSQNDIWFDLNDIDIRIGSRDYEKKVRILSDSILEQFADELDKIAYIDLRFKDYVVGYKK